MRWLSWLFILAVSAWGQSPTERPADRATILNQEGVAFYEKGSWNDAIKKFQAARRLKPKNKTIARNLANSLYGRGIAHAKANDLDAAHKDLKRAVVLNPEEHLLHTSLGSILLRKAQNDEARVILERALRKFPGKSACHEAMGRLEYAEEHLTEALQFLQTAAKLDPERGKKFAAFMAKVKREAQIEGRFFVERRGPFTVKYDDAKFRDVSQEVLEILDTNYNELARDLQHWPKRQVTVVLYTRGDYDKATGANHWTGGLFDGKIRLPVRNYSSARTQIASTLAHELSHFFVRSLTRRCPLWLDEGLAQMRQGREASSVKQLLVRHRDSKTLVPIWRLPRSWTGIKDRGKVSLYYASALSFTSWLKRHFGFSSIVDLLKALEGGKSFDKVFADVFGRTFKQASEDWQRGI